MNEILYIGRDRWSFNILPDGYKEYIMDDYGYVINVTHSIQFNYAIDFELNSHFTGH